jgi:PhzF family phenazine biosynthesis protein
MSRYDFSLVDAFGHGPLEGATVAVVQAADDPGPLAQRIAASLGASATVFVLPPRRDDCERRVRVLTPWRELPLSAKGAFAAAAALGLDRPIALEQGVIRTVVSPSPMPDGAMGWALPVARPVINGRPVEDRTLAASALALDPSDLSEGLPVQSASCGWLTVMVPVATRDALARATLQPALWQRVIEKAKPFGAVAFVPSPEGPVAVRCLVPRVGEDPGTGLACASLAAYLVRFGVRPAGPHQRITFEQGNARVHVVIDGLGDHDDATHVLGRATPMGGGWLDV